MASAEPWNCRLPSRAWVGALGLDETASLDSAKSAVSKIMRRLEERKLITRVRSKRLSDVFLLKEDGSGDLYERPLKGPEDWWLQLPHTYWLEGHYKTLRLPTKVMLLIALSLRDRFPLPYDRAHDWYGVSADSAEQGLRQLRDTGLLAAERNWIKAPRSETGWTEQLTYTLQGSFSTAERKKASRIRSQAMPMGDGQDTTAVQPRASRSFAGPAGSSRTRRDLAAVGEQSQHHRRARSSLAVLHRWHLRRAHRHRRRRGLSAPG
jgi:hypothetical protein